MFLDEPFAGVNPFLRDEIIGFVQALHAKGKPSWWWITIWRRSSAW